MPGGSPTGLGGQCAGARIAKVAPVTLAPTAASRLPVVAALLLAACMTRPPAPVSERTPLASRYRPAAAATGAGGRRRATRARAAAPTYTVKRGDTLAQIALDNGLDYRELAAWNNIENPNVIRVGQVLVLAAPGNRRAPVVGQGGDDAAGRCAADRAEERRRRPTRSRRR